MSLGGRLLSVLGSRNNVGRVSRALDCIGSTAGHPACGREGKAQIVVPAASL